MRFQYILQDLGELPIANPSDGQFEWMPSPLSEEKLKKLQANFCPEQAAIDSCRMANSRFPDVGDIVMVQITEVNAQLNIKKSHICKLNSFLLLF